MRHRLLIASLSLLTPAFAAEPVDPAEEMFTVQFVVLKDGPNREKLADEVVAQRQGEHLKGLEALMRSGQALIVGPVESEDTWRGIAVIDVDTKDKAIALFANDPWIKSGHLVVESRPWYVAKKVLRPLKGEFTDLEACLLGLLERPENAPQLSPEQSKQVQAGHMQNIHAMAESGDLAVAGPFVEDTPLRGIFVFRTTDRARVESLVARDAAVQAGRLKVRFMTWWVSKNALPPTSPH